MTTHGRRDLFDAAATAALASVGGLDGVVEGLLDDVDAGLDRERALRELRGLLRVATRAGEAATFDDLVEAAADAACLALDADSVAISTLDLEAGTARVLVNAGRLAPWEQRRPADETYGLAEYTWIQGWIAEGRPFAFSASDPAAPAAAAEVVRSQGKEHALLLPVFRAETAWGDIWATRPAGRPAFDERSFRLGLAIARVLGGALDRAALFERIAALAHRDELTGLANRRVFEERLAAALAAPVGPVTVAIGDVDRFKRTNDRLGHEAGDGVLMAVARSLEAAAGDALVARAGGDEFWILLEGAGPDRAVEIAHAAAIGLGAGREPGPQLSWGVASVVAETEAPDVLRQADAALYAAKQAGRGRIRVADPAAPGFPPPSSDRRAVRDAAHGAASASLEGLEGGTPEERLALVASVLAEDIDAAAWLLSELRDGEIVLLRGWDCDLDRRSGLRTVRPAAVPPMALDDFPRTATAVDEQSTYVIDARSEAGPAELAFLRRYGYQGSITFGARLADGRGLMLELFADDRTAPLRPFQPVLQRLARRAIAG